MSTDKKNEEDVGLIEPDEFVYDPKREKFVRTTMTPELYRQKNLAARQKGLIAAGAGVAGELGQFLVGLSTLSDPAVKEARRDKAQLRAEMAKGPDLLTESEMSARREAALAPVERQIEALQQRTEKISASTGRFDARSMIASGEAGVGQARQAALDVEAKIAAEQVAREQIKKKEDMVRQQRIDSINAMLLNLRNENVRRPLQRMIKSAATLGGKALAYAPAKGIDNQIKNLERLKVPPEDIAEVNRLLATEPKKGRKMIRELFKEYGTDTNGDDKKTETGDVKKPEPVEVDVGFKDADEFWKGKKRGDGDDFRRWARANYSDEVLVAGDTEEARQANLDASGPVTSKAFKDAWNKYGEEYLKDKQSRNPGRVPSVAEIESGVKGFEEQQPGVYTDPTGNTVRWEPSRKSFFVLPKDGTSRTVITLAQMQDATEGTYPARLLQLAKANNFITGTQ